MIDWWLIFMAGIMGSGHCVGMCGSLVSAFFIRFSDNKSHVHVMIYHLTRVGVYTALGMLAGLIGQSVVMTGLAGKGQGLLKIGVGLVIILLGIELLGLSPWPVNFRLLSIAASTHIFKKAQESGLITAAMLGGFVNGFMPCALVFAMITKAISAGTVVLAGGTMLVFGIGTLPSMLFVSYALNKVSPQFRGVISRGAGIFVILLGLKTLWEGVQFFNVMKNLANL